MKKIDLSALKGISSSQDNSNLITLTDNSNKDTIIENTDKIIEENKSDNWVNSGVSKISLIWIKTPENMVSNKIDTVFVNTLSDENKDIKNNNESNLIKIITPIIEIEKENNQENKQKELFVKPEDEINTSHSIDINASDTSELFANYNSNYSLDKEKENIQESIQVEYQELSIWDISENKELTKPKLSKKIKLLLALWITWILVIFWLFQTYSVKTSIIDINNVKNDDIKLKDIKSPDIKKDSDSKVNNIPVEPVKTNNDILKNKKDEIKLKMKEKEAKIKSKIKKHFIK